MKKLSFSCLDEKGGTGGSRGTAKPIPKGQAQRRAEEARYFLRDSYRGRGGD